MQASSSRKSTDVLIVGAGVAGSALAYALGKEHCLSHIDAQELLGYAFFKDGKSIKISYSSEDAGGRCFHNGRFIQKMREKVATLYNVNLEQGTVTSLIEENGRVKGVHYKTTIGESTAYAPLTVICDGSFSNLRRTLCNAKVDTPSSSIGLVLENCQLPYANHGHIVIADPSLVLFGSISSTKVRCLVDVPGKRVPSISNGEMANYLKTVVAPQIPSELQHAFVSAIDEGTIRKMRNRSMAAAPYSTPGAVLLGDALNMRHPLTGSGMTVALFDVVLLRDILRALPNLNSTSLLRKKIRSFYSMRQPVAATMNTLADTTYTVMSSSEDPARREMREICFECLSVGGRYRSRGISLLSGVNPHPMSLALHFFAMASYGISRLLLPFPSPTRMWAAARLIPVTTSIIFPIIKAEAIRHLLKFFHQLENAV